MFPSSRKTVTALVLSAAALLLATCDRVPELLGNSKIAVLVTTTETRVVPTEPPSTPPVQEKGCGLYAFYPFNGNALDATGNGHNATVSGATLTTDRFGKVKSAYQFDGIDDYVIYKGMCGFPAGTAARTVSGWFLSNVTDPYIMMMFGWGAQIDGRNFQVGVGPGTPGTQYRVNGWGDSYDWRTGVIVPEYLDGKWHHCAVTYDGRTTSIYFDGELRGTTKEFSYVSVPGSMDLVIGREIDLAGWEWQGALDDVGVYTRALEPEEIALLAANK